MLPRWSLAMLYEAVSPAFAPWSPEAEGIFARSARLGNSWVSRNRSECICIVYISMYQTNACDLVIGAIYTNKPKWFAKKVLHRWALLGASALNLMQYVNYLDLYNLKLWSWYVYPSNGRALFDSWLYFLKGTECCLWSKNWGTIKRSGRSLTDGHWFLDWLITLSCDHNCFGFRLQFPKGTGDAESYLRRDKVLLYAKDFDKRTW